MAKWSLTTKRLWARVGLRETEEPEVVYAVQPTVQIGDFSGLIPPILPALAWVGGEELSAVARHVFDVQAVAPGGCFVRHFRVYNSATVEVRWAVLQGPAVITGAVSTIFNMGPVPVTSITQIGTVVANTVPDNAPHGQPGANTAFTLDDLIYIPPGFHFRYEYSGVAASFQRFSAVIQDVAEAIPANPT